MSTTPRLLEIVHTPFFTASAKGVLTEEQIHEIEVTLATTPEVGRTIAGTNGARKVRYALPGRGKSGGARVIYFAHLPCDTIYLLFVYAKNDRENLTPEQKKAARQLVQFLENEGC
jgi:hypothetical protein